MTGSSRWQDFGSLLHSHTIPRCPSESCRPLRNLHRERRRRGYWFGRRDYGAGKEKAVNSDKNRNERAPSRNLCNLRKSSTVHRCVSNFGRSRSISCVPVIDTTVSCSGDGERSGWREDIIGLWLQRISFSRSLKSGGPGTLRTPFPF